MPGLAAMPAVVAKPAPDAFDLVMFWKQNDSGIYGRRSDMMMKHLIASGRVRRVLQLDAPLEVQDLAKLADPARGSAGAHVLRNTIANQYGLRDSDTMRMRTYLWDRKGKRSVLPHVGKSLADYPAWVEALMGFPTGWTDGPLDPETLPLFGNLLGPSR